MLKVYASSSNVGFSILDADLRFRVVSQPLAKMNGLPVEVHLGRTVREVLGDAAETVEACLHEVLAAAEPILGREISLQPRERSEPGHWVANYLPIKDSSGRVSHIGVVVVEVTKQKKLEDSFRGLSRVLDGEKKRSKVMSEVSRLLAGKLELKRTFPKISSYVRRLLHQEYAGLVLRHQDTGHLLVKAQDFPLQRSVGNDWEISAEDDPVYEALDKGTPLIFTEERMRQADSPATQHLLQEGLRSLCCVPLVGTTEPIGVLVMGSTRRDAFRTGDLDILQQIGGFLAIALENDLATRQLEKLRRRLSGEKTSREMEMGRVPAFPGMVGESFTFQKLMNRVLIVAITNATVLLLGETGTGKGLVARAIHEASRRKERRFVTLNCAAIPTGLLESELFGHEKGAFTGAVNQKMGRLELADGGTLFLDEIGEIPLEIQPKLLRVLQDQEFERLGGVHTIRVNIRLVAATNRDLARSVLSGEFRSDLFYRLNVFPLHVPPLRERRDDIPILAHYFVQKFAAKMERPIETIPRQTMSALVDCSWPGNVRELENFIERSVILTEGTELRAPLADLHSESSQEGTASLEFAERSHIIRILRETNGVISGPAGAALRLGLKRTTLQSKMERLGITAQDYQDSPPS